MSFMSDSKLASITALNRLAQKCVIQQALKMSNIISDEVDNIRAHRTGTALGDLIKMEALAGVFEALMNNSSSMLSHLLLVGSVKSNIGHLEMVAGMAGLINVLATTVVAGAILITAIVAVVSITFIVAAIALLHLHYQYL